MICNICIEDTDTHKLDSLDICNECHVLVDKIK
jgi:hypothetical protein